MNQEKKKILALVSLSLSGSFQLFFLFMIGPAFQEAAFLLIVLSLFLVFSSLPYTAEGQAHEHKYRIRIAGAALLQAGTCLLLFYE